MDLIIDNIEEAIVQAKGQLKQNLPDLIGIFQDEENEDHLFALKLALFEVKEIRDSKDNEGKKKLRQSKYKIEVLKIAFDLVK